MLHANAALAPRQRLRLARRVVDVGWAVARATEWFQVSWPTAKRWAQRPGPGPVHGRPAQAGRHHQSAAGVSLPRTASDQFHAGTPVTDLGQLRPGDLVFVPGAEGTMQAPGHVGIYLGGGLIIDAPHTGDVVHIGQLRPYWTSNLAGMAVRSPRSWQVLRDSCGRLGGFSRGVPNRTCRRNAVSSSVNRAAAPLASPGSRARRARRRLRRNSACSQLATGGRGEVGGQVGSP